MLAGLEEPSIGKIFVDGQQIQGIHPSRSMLFQQPTLIPWLSVKDNVAYGCKLRGDTKNLDYRVNQFLEIMGIAGFANVPPVSTVFRNGPESLPGQGLCGTARNSADDEPFAVSGYLYTRPTSRKNWSICGCRNSLPGCLSPTTLMKPSGWATKSFFWQESRPPLKKFLPLRNRIQEI